MIISKALQEAQNDGLQAWLTDPARQLVIIIPWLLPSRYRFQLLQVSLSYWWVHNSGEPLSELANAYTLFRFRLTEVRENCCPFECRESFRLRFLQNSLLDSRSGGGFFDNFGLLFPFRNIGFSLQYAA